jgi:O-antigen/teichoic acid export membrane protein
MTDTDRNLPRGAFYVALGQGVFLLTGYILHAFLARWLTPSQYGIFGVSMVVLGWAEITVNNGVPSALQRFLPDRFLSETSIRRAAACCQALIGIGIFLALFLIAPWIAALLRDVDLTIYLRLAFLDIPVMGAYAYYRGVLNGWRVFRQLSLSIMAYSLTKLVAICLLVIAGLEVQGALIGNVVSSLGGLVVALFWVRRRTTSRNSHPVQRLRVHQEASVHSQVTEAERAVGMRQIMAFVVPTVLFTLASNILLGLDLMGVKALGGDADQVGYYTAAVNLANAPRLVLLAFSFALLPSLSHAIARRDDAQTRRYLQQILHLLALVLFPVLALVMTTAEPLVTFVFSAAYRSAAPILRVLIVTYSAYTVYITLVMILLAENKPGRALAIPVVLLPVAIGLVWLGVNRLGTLGAAYASLLSVTSAAAVVVGYAFRRFKPAVSVRSMGRIALAAVAVGAVAWFWAPSGLVLIPSYVLLGTLYLLLLLILREIKLQDLALMRP